MRKVSQEGEATESECKYLLSLSFPNSQSPICGGHRSPAVQAGASTSKVDKWSGRKHILEMLGFHRALSRLVIGLPRLSRARKCRGDFHSISSKKDLVKSRGF